ncbi:GNAT family N-acetyltransferase [Allomuricauda sp. SCSIO 65647]|uniref:GNAT family N-acetyltransferase n=1 Tax=Allomuricauda sp. SCSIO 65647 TaxID=2908843 RepID=UPI001F33143E|nr:GNAT family N-acetyltransferase [Muricauda sp. SCSIO 65647]UJH67416.1 GNAT family N-acetyltransferase [Muricauda sp. SCSIO 65647]
MKPFESLNTSRTRIRKFLPKDRDRLIELLCDRSVTQHMAFPEEMLTEKGVSGLLETTIAFYESETPLLSYAITHKKDDCLIGVTGYTILTNNEIEVFYALLPAYWGKGLATEILVTLTDHVFSSEDFDAVVAPITKANKASIRVAEKAGFTNHGLQEHPDYNDLVFMLKKEKLSSI